MAIDALVTPLLALPLFRGLKLMQITEIARRVDRIVYRAGDLIIKEDEAGDAAIVIISGDAAHISAVGGELAEPVLQGSMIAELAMLIETIHNSTVIARSEVRALRLSRADMQALMQTEPALADHFSLRITERLKRLSTELKAIDEALFEVAKFDAPASIKTANAAWRTALLH